MTIYGQIEHYYAEANRERGNGHKFRGMAKLAAPSCGAYLVMMLLDGIPLLWASLAVLALCLLAFVRVLILFQFWPSSKNWRDRQKMKRVWFWKGLIAYLISGWPLGFLLTRVGDIYGDEFKYETTETKAKVERREAPEFFKAEWQCVLFHIIAVFVARLI